MATTFKTIAPKCLAIAIAIAAQFLCQRNLAIADGGTLRTSQRIGLLQVSVFTSPTELRAGPIDISVLVQDAETGRVREDLPVKVAIDQINADGETLLNLPEQNATSAMATNKLFRAAMFDIPRVGKWRANVSIGESTVNFSGQKRAPNANGEPPVRGGNDESSANESPNKTVAFDFEVVPPLPAWFQLTPWIALPFLVITLFLVHQVFVRIAEKRLTLSHHWQ